MRSASKLRTIRPQPSPEQLVSWLKLHELARFDLSTGCVERAAEALGREVAEDEKLGSRAAGSRRATSANPVPGDGAKWICVCDERGRFRFTPRSVDLFFEISFERDSYRILILSHRQSDARLDAVSFARATASPFAVAPSGHRNAASRSQGAHFNFNAR